METIIVHNNERLLLLQKSLLYLHTSQGKSDCFGVIFKLNLHLADSTVLDHNKNEFFC
jgi:hypothetical protein